jgi:hypothetical protein
MQQATLLKKISFALTFLILVAVLASMWFGIPGFA